MGSSNLYNFKTTCDQSREGPKTSKKAELKRSLGRDSLVVVISEEKNYYKASPTHRPNPFNEEIKSLQYSPVKEKQNLTLTEATRENNSSYEEKSEDEEKEETEEGSEEGNQQRIQLEVNAITVVTERDKEEENSENFNNLQLHATENDRSMDWQLKKSNLSTNRS